MEGEIQVVEGYRGSKKSIPEVRDRLQSRVLVLVLVPFLLFGAVSVTIRSAAASASPFQPLVLPVLFSFGLAALAWRTRSSTLAAAGTGLAACMILSQAPMGLTGLGGTPLARPALMPLIALSLLAFGATRFGRTAKERRGLAEHRSGRQASQILANIGVAAFCAWMGWYAGCIAALAEAAADTVSSEIGQAVGGKAWLITTFRRVLPGKDGGVSLAGSVAGVAAVGVVVGAGSLHHALGSDPALVFTAACVGLLFDSFLGATVEERGWLGNDLVNFSSTLLAATLPYVWIARSR
ncbi:DUF92 domain-containing protein [Granulicella sp. S190]|uniref:DUF92 domain-containing protein n=1 Tax=Granulicella sp. S190 TaxID=1747226 RepID=UPI00131CFBA1|nr:DUF92 domain-containing protein [Granulicella sp. S190]